MCVQRSRYLGDFGYNVERLARPDNFSLGEYDLRLDLLVAVQYALYDAAVRLT